MLDLVAVYHHALFFFRLNILPAPRPKVTMAVAFPTLAAFPLKRVAKAFPERITLERLSDKSATAVKSGSIVTIFRPQASNSYCVTFPFASIFLIA